jgi:hypothetical protein
MASGISGVAVPPLPTGEREVPAARWMVLPDDRPSRPAVHRRDGHGDRGLLLHAGVDASE